MPKLKEIEQGTKKQIDTLIPQLKPMGFPAFVVKKLYDEYLKEHGERKAHELLYTTYHSKNRY